MRRLKVLASLSLLGFLGCSGATEADAESISELIGLADQANTRFEVKKEERYLRAALRLDGSGRERAEARRKLARVRWKFHQDYREASELLSEAVEVGAEVAKAWAERAEMERVRGRLAEAMAAAEKAVASAQGAFQRRAAVMALSAVVIDQVAQRRLDGGAEAGGGVAARVARALELQRELVRSQPGDPDTAKAMLSLAVALNRPQDACTPKG